MRATYCPERLYEGKQSGTVHAKNMILGAEGAMRRAAEIPSTEIMVMSEDRGSGGPSIALIAVIAVLVIAGLAIWFTTQQPTRESTTTTSEYRESVTPAENSGSTSQGTGTQQGTEPSPPDTSTGQ